MNNKMKDFDEDDIFDIKAIYEKANRRFKTTEKEKCPKCGELISLAVGSNTVAYLICEKCGNRVVTSMGKYWNGS